jgi:hypothetical protein
MEAGGGVRRACAYVGDMCARVGCVVALEGAFGGPQRWVPRRGFGTMDCLEVYYICCRRVVC